MFNFITITFNNENLDVLLDKTQFRNLKYFLFNLLKEDLSEGIRIVMETPNVILTLLSLEYIVFVSNKMVFTNVDILSIY